MLERPRQLRRLQQVGLPDGERAALRGPGDDVVAAGIADEVPRFPAWGGRAASEDGVGRRRDGGGDLGGTGEISPGVGAPRNFLTCPTARASSHRPGRAYRSRFGASRGGTSRCVTSRGHTREMSRGQRTRPAPRARPAAAPLRDPRVRIRKKLGTSGGGGGTARRTIGTVTRSRWRTGVVAPVALPGCALAPLAEVMSARVTSSSGLSLLTSHASNSQNEGYRTRMTNAPPPNSHSRESRTRITLL